MSRILLCIPPDYEHNFPPLGTPALSAFLKINGFDCIQVDLNLPYRDFLARHITGPDPLTREEQIFFLKPALRGFFTHKLQGRYYSGLLPRSSDGIFPDIPYGNNTNSSFYFCERLLSSEHLWRYLADDKENTFYQFFLSCGILAALKSERIDILGISVISPTQAVACLTLGLLVKKAYPHIHVTIGGQWPTLYREAIMHRKDLFACFDSMVVFEGEHALLELAKRLGSGQDISSIPNVLVRDSVSCRGLACRNDDMDSLPCPDFDGLPLADYDGSRDGDISITFETSRGCYWSKCAYCVDLPLPKPSYRQKNASLVVNDMRQLKERYNAAYLLFGDPGLSPRQMRAISEKSLQAAWILNGGPWRGLTPDSTGLYLNWRMQRD